MIRVILVDDEIHILRGLKSIIDWKRAGFVVVGAFDDATQALEEAPALRPQLVITDIELPGMSGLDLICALRAELPEAVFIVLSAHDNFTYAQTALRQGVFRYLLKPVVGGELLALLGEVRGKLQAQQAVKEADSSMLRAVILREVLSDGAVHAEHRQSGRYDELAQLQFRLLFLHARLAPDENWEYPLSPEALYQKKPALGADFSGHLAVFPYRSSVVVVLPGGGAAVDGARLAHAMAGELGQTVVVAETPDCHGLAGAHEYFLTAHAFFEQCCFYSSGPEYIRIKEPAPLSAELPAALWADVRGNLPRLMARAELAELEALCDRVRGGIRAMPQRLPQEVVVSLYRRMTELAAETADVLSSKNTHKRMPLPRLHYLEDYHRYVVQRLKHWTETVTAETDRADGAVNAVIMYVKENYASQNLTLRQVAEKHFINYSHLSHIFKQRTGTSFSAYLTGVRVERATHLLLQTDLPVADVAKQVGFSDGQTFYYTFKKVCGQSPRAFRRQQGALPETAEPAGEEPIQTKTRR